jgi:hypothetical protein
VGAKTLEAQLADGAAKFQGNVSVLAKLASTMIEFDPRFEVMPGSHERPPVAYRAAAYEAVPEQIIAE